MQFGFDVCRISVDIKTFLVCFSRWKSRCKSFIFLGCGVLETAVYWRLRPPTVIEPICRAFQLLFMQSLFMDEMVTGAKQRAAITRLVDSSGWRRMERIEKENSSVWRHSTGIRHLLSSLSALDRRRRPHADDAESRSYSGSNIDNDYRMPSLSIVYFFFCGLFCLLALVLNQIEFSRIDVNFECSLVDLVRFDRPVLLVTLL